MKYKKCAKYLKADFDLKIWKAKIQRRPIGEK